MIKHTHKTIVKDGPLIGKNSILTKWEVLRTLAQQCTKFRRKSLRLFILNHMRKFLKGVNYMGMLYIQKESGGEKISVPAVAELKIEKPGEDTIEFPTLLYREGSVEFDCKSVINRNLLLRLLTGFPVTNNWLKMHGGIMSRTKRRKRS